MGGIKIERVYESENKDFAKEIRIFEQEFLTPLKPISLTRYSRIPEVVKEEIKRIDIFKHTIGEVYVSTNLKDIELSMNTEENKLTRIDNALVTARELGIKHKIAIFGIDNPQMSEDIIDYLITIQIANFDILIPPTFHEDILLEKGTPILKGYKETLHTFIQKALERNEYTKTPKPIFGVIPVDAPFGVIKDLLTIYLKEEYREEMSGFYFDFRNKDLASKRYLERISTNLVKIFDELNKLANSGKLSLPPEEKYLFYGGRIGRSPANPAKWVSYLDFIDIVGNIAKDKIGGGRSTGRITIPDFNMYQVHSVPLSEVPKKLSDFPFDEDLYNKLGDNSKRKLIYAYVDYKDFKEGITLHRKTKENNEVQYLESKQPLRTVVKEIVKIKNEVLGGGLSKMF